MQQLVTRQGYEQGRPTPTAHATTGSRASRSRDSNFGGSSRTVGEKKQKTAYGQGLKGRQSLPVDEGGRIWHAHGGGCLIAHFSLSLQAMALSSRGRQSREEGRSSHVPHTKATHSLIIIMAAAGCPMSVALGLSGVSRRSVGQSPPSLSLSEPVGRSVHSASRWSS